jgi:hypothetical protein
MNPHLAIISITLVVFAWLIYLCASSGSVKQYLHNLWLALCNSKIPSGLEPDSWYKVTKDGGFSQFVLTDKFGHIVPFTVIESGYTFEYWDTSQ